jgi:hypothetical protein
MANGVVRLQTTDENVMSRLSWGIGGELSKQGAGQIGRHIGRDVCKGVQT